ncbi:hypothetical protein M7I_4304 [Glarea lozoyensis 74030]|uniref:Uncharacterized protein n=1 Tax=Glarea lozoyensis (strain ATCC 74030 / MF5533) TaxID=1104152 RepID=H0ENU1_GLAL7|nr:hypothetical protein M7I_4304 [Glarea lozoyensis 74030]
MALSKDLDPTIYSLTFRQQVYAKTLAAHPDFNVHAQITANIASAAKVTKRNKSNHFCSQDIGNPWRPAKVDKIVDGIHYLQNKARCGVNPRSCARISCSWDSAIFLCNDRNDFIQPSCAYLASYASDIINFCHQDVNGIGIAVAGQEFDTENYNVLVRYSNC